MSARDKILFHHHHLNGGRLHGRYNGRKAVLIGSVRSGILSCKRVHGDGHAADSAKIRLRLEQGTIASLRSSKSGVEATASISIFPGADIKQYGYRKLLTSKKRARTVSQL